MLGKIRLCFTVIVLATTLSAADNILIVGSTGLGVQPATGWTRQEGGTFLLRGPGKDGALAPRFTVTVVSGTIADMTTAFRKRFSRVAAGSEILNEDDVPLGGRTWHRLRTHLAIGPIVLGQSIWIGSINGHTIVAVLSTGDDFIQANVSIGADMVSSLREVIQSVPQILTPAH